MMPSRITRILSLTTLAVFILGILGYALFQSRALIAGPELTIHPPVGHIASSSDRLVRINGHVNHVSFVTLNNREVEVGSDGDFHEKLLLPDGYTIIEMTAKDRFGRTITKTLELLH